ncbi:MAG: hypothetical protein WCS70_12325 [Verrucomicrobiota bacterium]
MSTGKSIRWVKFVFAVFLIPACVGATIAATRLGLTLLAGTTVQSALAFGAGYGLWLIIFCFLPKPVRTYVLGHELTHAIWALLMGARVSGLKVGKAGGQVQTSKTNWAITLAPYFFPFYAVLFIIGFFIAHAIWNLTAYLWVLFFLVGLGWSFHVTFTCMVLFTVSQPDVESQGVLFSFVVIYLMNLLTMTLVATLLSPALSFGMLGTAFGKNIWQSYAWTLDKSGLLWEYAHAVWSHRQ